MKVVAMKFLSVRLRFPSVRHIGVVLAMIMCATYVLAFFNMRREIYMSFVDPSQTINEDVRCVVEKRRTDLVGIIY